MSQVQALRSASSSPMPVAPEASRFSPSEIRQAIASWVAQDRLDMADALVAAGLAQYPDSEDILAIAALLAEVNQDWAQAQHCLERLMAVQGEQVRAETCYHLVRVMRCRSAYFNALIQAQTAVEKFPEHAGLKEAYAELLGMLDVGPLAVKVEAQVA